MVHMLWGEDIVEVAGQDCGRGSVTMLTEAVGEALQIPEVRDRVRELASVASRPENEIIAGLRRDVLSHEEDVRATVQAEWSRYVAAEDALRETERRFLTANVPAYQKVDEAAAELTSQFEASRQGLKGLIDRLEQARTEEMVVGVLGQRSRQEAPQGTWLSRLGRSRPPEPPSPLRELEQQSETAQVRHQELANRAAAVLGSKRQIEMRWASRVRESDDVSSVREKCESQRIALRNAMVERAVLPRLRAALDELSATSSGPEQVVARVGAPPVPEVDPSGDAQEAGVPAEVREAVRAVAADVVGPGDRRSVFLVHGRDRGAAQAMRDLLRAMRLEVIEWEHAVELTGEPSPYVGDVVFAGMKLADAVVVLLTPDDLVRLRDDLQSEDEAPEDMLVRGQARPNVIYEAGIADALGRSRTVLVEVGNVRALSDLGGRNTVRFDGGPASRHRLAGRLRAADLQLNTGGEDWLTSGDFETSMAKARAAVARAAGQTASGTSTGPHTTQANAGDDRGRAG